MSLHVGSDLHRNSRTSGEVHDAQMRSSLAHCLDWGHCPPVTGKWLGNL